MIAIAIFSLGTCVGSFLNVCIYRLPREVSIVWPGSHCTACGMGIKWYENIPVISFLWMRARCHCRETRIALRYPLVEVLTGAMCMFAYIQWGTSAYAGMAALLWCAFIVITFIDYDYQIIPDEITLPAIVIGLVFSFFFPEWLNSRPGWPALTQSIGGVLAGGGFLYAVGLLGEWLFKKEAMGGGDVKLLAAIGAFMGWQGVAITIFVASLVGALVGGVLRVTKGHERIPFGPFIVVGAFIYMIYGQSLITWYWQHSMPY